MEDRSLAVLLIGCIASRTLNWRRCLSGGVLLASALLGGCSVASSPAVTFQPAGATRPTDHVVHSEAIDTVITAYERLPDLPRLPEAATPARWAYAVGNPTRGLSVDAAAMPEADDTVTLRHRVLEPNTPLWYRCSITLDSAHVMHVSADDGAQVFAEGELLPIYQPNHFVLWPSAESLDVRVRVLNNAMQGGLNGVQLYPKSAFDRHHAALRRRGRLDTLVTKLKRWRRPPADAAKAVFRAVQADTDEAVRAAEAALARWPMIVVGPYLQEPGPDKMTIVWETDVPAEEAYVRWGEVGEPAAQRTAATLENGVFVARLDGLTPGTVYSYRVYTGASASATYRFVTDRLDGPVSFSVWSDSQSGWPVFSQNVRAMRDLPIDFTIGLGDFVSNGSEARAWYDFFETIRPLASRVPVHLIPGNHDYDGFYNDLRPRYLEKYARNGAHPNYKAWSYGNARFVAIDPNENFPIGLREGSPQHEWFLEELASEAWQSATWRFVFVHQPPFGQTWKGYHGDKAIRDLLVPIAPEAGIDFVISGHNHSYERLTRRSDGQTTHYVILGGAGGGLDEPPYDRWPKMDRTASRHHYGHFTIDGGMLRFEVHTSDREKVLDTIVLEQ